MITYEQYICSWIFFFWVVPSVGGKSNVSRGVVGVELCNVLNRTYFAAERDWLRVVQRV